MEHPNFISGDFDTHFIQKYFSEPATLNGNEEEEKIASSFSAWLFRNNKEKIKLLTNDNSEWEIRKIIDS